MMYHNDDDDLVMAGTKSSANAEGLVPGHAYVVQHVQVTNSGTKMVRLRNPWGYETYTGAYSDATATGNANWTEALREELDHWGSDRQDGVFWMDYDSYYSNFGDTNFNKDTTGWHTSSYLKLDDTTR